MKQGVLRTSPSLRSRSRWSSRLGTWTDFFNPVSCTWSDFTGLYSTLLDSCRLFLSPGPSFLAANSPWRRFAANAGRYYCCALLKSV